MRHGQIGREPGDEEVGGEVHAEEADHHSPYRSVTEQGADVHFFTLIDHVHAAIFQQILALLLVQTFHLFRFAVERQPDADPNQAQRTGNDKRGFPVPGADQPGHQRQGDGAARTRTGIEDAAGGGAFFFSKPRVDHFGAARIATGFAQAEHQA